MKRRLIILPNNPGDVLMGLHAAQALKHTYPEDPLAYVVDSECAPLVEGNPYIDLTLVIPRKSIRNAPNVKEAASQLEQFLRECRAYAPDQIINLFQGDYGAILATLIPSSERYGKQYDTRLGRIVVQDTWTRYILSIPAHRSANPWHAIELYQRVCGLAPQTPQKLNLPSVATEEQKRLHSRIPNRPYLAFQPGSAWLGKQWPIQYWIELANLQLENTHFDIILMGSPQERNLNQQILSSLPTYTDRVHDLAGATSLTGTQVILQKAQCLVTGDTFTMHMASAVRTPVLALFGPSNPVETGPYQPGAQILMSSASDSNSENLAFRDPSIISCITPADVFAVLQGQTVPNLLQTYWDGQTLRLHGKPNHSSNDKPPEAIDIDEMPTVCHSLLLEQKNTIEQLLLTPTLYTLQSALHTQEQQLAATTNKLISFEMYRIALNSLPEKPLIHHLRGRYELVKRYLFLLEKYCP